MWCVRSAYRLHLPGVRGPLFEVGWGHLFQGQSFVSTPDPPGDHAPPHGTDNMKISTQRADNETPRFPGLPARIWRRSLSPLDRVSHMVSPEFISPEIQALRSAGVNQEDMQIGHSATLNSGEPPDTPGQDSDLQPSLDNEPEWLDPQGAPFKSGDLIVSEFKKRHYTEFKKMFLLKPSGKLTSNWGAISHADIEGKLPGQKFRTSTGFELLLKRPTLDEYVTMMKRGPTISYPKDIAAMLMMMDINPGDTVLEAGSGSGGMSLFLSRAVGSEGRVYSFDVRADHQAIAKNNFQRWMNAWTNRCRKPWPDNVSFINKDITNALSDIKSVTFDAVALDMLNPQVALPVILQNLKQGAVCAAYLANITQVIDLLEGIRSCQLFLVCEKIVEVSYKDWLVAPSVRKDGSISPRVEPEKNIESDPEYLEQPENEESDSDAQNPSVEIKPFGQVPYIARPLPWQTGHTAFLVQLRKFKPALKYSDPEKPRSI
ncbi:tRNA (adenine(58)-N(1))-methyltransferase, mitochondrial [Pelobates fuscus]|uniref:tRNA (adenine(58)-N(1))-methyltransferase, mitochondrial n=1 Tax=Pelobates fuscus TaxID=191477 RepID=UPI002FE4F467